MQVQSSRQVKTFTVGFDEAGFDEAPHAHAVARHLATDHHEIRVTPSEARAVIPNLQAMYDEPFGDSSQIPTSIVCAVARRKVTVALSGDAGDELLGGYNRYVVGPRLWRGLSKAPAAVRGMIGPHLSAMPDSAWALAAQLPGLGRALGPFRDKAHKIGTPLGAMKSADDLYPALVSEWSGDDVPVLGAKQRLARLDDLLFAAIAQDATQRMMLLDSVTYLPDDILAKVDRAAMAVSLETRVPLLDHRVAELAWRLPLSMKVRDGKGKWALRQVLYRHVPQELVERPKAGFAIPVGRWLRGPLRDWADDLLSQHRLKADGYLDPDVIGRLWSEHRSGARDWTARLWNVLMFLSWLVSQSNGACTHRSEIARA